MIATASTPSQDKIALDFVEISRRLRCIAERLPEVDLVVGVATGGTVPASLAAYELGLPLAIVQINYRAEDNTPQRPAPELLGAAQLPPDARTILLVDDVSVSGQTLALARSLLAGRQVTTLVMKGAPGSADFVLFDDLPACVYWPWKLD
jgi:hypoxanthine phosphoribosyltransferase